MDPTVALALIRMAAADRTLPLWGRPSDAALVRLGLDALLAGVDVFSLPLLAGLAHGEYGEARELFDQVVAELDLLPQTPEELAEARWTAARWWARRIVTHELDPLEGARLICWEVAAELGYPAELKPLVTLVEAADRPDDDRPPPEPDPDGIIRAARALLAPEPREPLG
ncbi:hypothetical protein [Streptomyces sp. NPDC047097]|uniref:hypothetical protein n=1 Tax=Streptomyces sp. NPDC047097 TaxID=3155260 RepID=UPI0033DC8364